MQSLRVPVTMSSTPTALSSRIEPRDAPTREVQRTEQALQALRIIVASYGLDTAMLGLFAWAGSVEGEAALVMGLGGMLVFAAFRLVFSMRLNRRWRDDHLKVPQLAASSALVLGIAAWFPLANLLVVTLIFVVFAPAALRLELRQLVPSRIAITLGIACVVGTARGRCRCRVRHRCRPRCRRCGCRGSSAAVRWWGCTDRACGSG